MKRGDNLQVSLDGTVKYAGHEIVKYKDGRVFVNLSVVDSDNVPFVIFCPGVIADDLKNIQFGQDISISFEVRRWNNSLTLRAKEVFV